MLPLLLTVTFVGITLFLVWDVGGAAPSIGF